MDLVWVFVRLLIIVTKRWLSRSIMIVVIWLRWVIFIQDDGLHFVDFVKEMRGSLLIIINRMRRRIRIVDFVGDTRFSICRISSVAKRVWRISSGPRIIISAIRTFCMLLIDDRRYNCRLRIVIGTVVFYKERSNLAQIVPKITVRWRLFYRNCKNWNFEHLYFLHGKISSK